MESSAPSILALQGRSVSFTTQRKVHLWQEFPLLSCASQATMVADNLVRVSNSHGRRWPALFGCNVPRGRVADRRLSSWRRPCLPSGRSPGL